MSEVIPRKLSKETLDILFKELAPYNEKTTAQKIPYTYADGTTTNVAPALLTGASTPFQFLITQTYPYHDKSQTYHPITDLMFILTENGKKVPWTRDVKDMQFFMQAAQACMGLHTTKGADVKTQFVAGLLKPTFYNEKTGQFEHKSKIKEHDPR